MTDHARAPASGPPRPAAHGLARLAATVGGFGVARRLVLAVALGVLAVGALPPVHLVPLLIPAFTGLVWQLDGVRSRVGAFWLGWAFGLGFFGAGLYWVGIAFLVEAQVYGWMMPFAVLGLAAGLAIFVGLATLAVYLLPLTGTAARVLALTLAWSAAAWLRGHVLTGFPWNLTATVWDPWPVMLQGTALAGAYGLSLVTVFAAAAPATLASPGGWGRRLALPLVAVGLLGALAAGGSLRLGTAPAVGERVVDEVTLRLVQPSIAQADKWAPDKRIEHIKRYLSMTRLPGKGRVTHVIWPETALPVFLSNQPDLRGPLGRVTPDGGALLTGLPRVRAGDGGRRLYNSLVALGPSGDTLTSYDKFHLVPFGEYVPFEDWLPLDKLTPGRTGFSAGPGPRTLQVPGAPPLSPLICYEAIFPGNVTGSGPRPGWLLNVTNDAWFGRSSGPYQHLASARLRAVEEGLPLVRAANTGISVVVDPWGRTLARLDLGVSDILDSPLPRAVPATPYARFGDATHAVLLLLVAGGVVLVRRWP
jgi:apolipoprotein N-acyltransferase